MSAKKKTTTTATAPAATAAALVTVEVINQPIYEADAHRAKGARFELSAQRAAALRHFVRIVTA